MCPLALTKLRVQEERDVRDPWGDKGEGAHLGCVPLAGLLRAKLLSPRHFPLGLPHATHLELASATQAVRDGAPVPLGRHGSHPQELEAGALGLGCTPKCGASALPSSQILAVHAETR